MRFIMSAMLKHCVQPLHIATIGFLSLGQLKHVVATHVILLLLHLQRRQTRNEAVHITLARAANEMSPSEKMVSQKNVNKFQQPIQTQHTRQSCFLDELGTSSRFGDRKNSAATGDQNEWWSRLVLLSLRLLLLCPDFDHMRPVQRGTVLSSFAETANTTPVGVLHH